MAHFARINDDSIVEEVIVINNDVLLENDVEVEQKGVDFCKSLFGEDTNWIQTSYSGKFRKNYAGQGYLYDPIRDAFIPPKPMEGEWVLNEDTCIWDLVDVN